MANKYLYKILLDKSKNPSTITNGDFITGWSEIKYRLTEELKLRVYGEIIACELSEVKNSTICFMTDDIIENIKINVEDKKTIAIIEGRNIVTDVLVNIYYIEFELITTLIE